MNKSGNLRPIRPYTVVLILTATLFRLAKQTKDILGWTNVGLRVTVTCSALVLLWSPLLIVGSTIPDIWRYWNLVDLPCNVFWYIMISRISKQRPYGTVTEKSWWFRSSFCFCQTNTPNINMVTVGPWVSYQMRKIAGCTCAGYAGNIFPTSDFKGNR